LKPVAANPRLTSIRGLALSDDGKQLYFADYDLGIYGIDLATGKGFDIGYNPLMLVLGGIDGLYFYDGNLVAIQGGMAPKRVVRLKLSSDGRSILKMVPLDVANPLFVLPTYGTVAGSELYFITNSQKGAYGKYGTPDEAKLQPVRIFKSDLRFAWNENGVNTAPKAAGAENAPPEAAKTPSAPAKKDAAPKKTGDKS